MVEKKYNHWLEKLDGTKVEYPSDLIYPSQVQSWAQEKVETVGGPEVYVYKWIHDKGEVVKKFYNGTCWTIDTFALEMFNDMCKNHDWYYNYSDDHRVWKAGVAAESKLKARFRTLLNGNLKESAQAIFDTYCPKNL